MTKLIPLRKKLAVLAILVGAATLAANAQDATPVNSPVPPVADKPADAGEQTWNWHVQNTDIVEGHPGFPADYSGPNSLSSHNDIRNTESLDLMAGRRLWPGAEAHVDGLMWQGFGFSNTLGAEGFPNGEAFRLGAKVPNVNFARLFIRQTIGLGGEQEDVADDELTLAGKQDVSRLTFTLGRISAEDIFDNNAYANDPRTQFMNWAFMANEAWDYPADSLGYITGATVELNQPSWAIRYGFFQVPQVSNGLGTDQHLLKAWAMVSELERRYVIGEHPGKVRLLAYLNRAPMGSYEEAEDNGIQPAVFPASSAYRYKYGFGLNWEQEVAKDVGVFSRLGWSDGENQGWMFSDVDYAASLGLSVKGSSWARPDDTVGLAGAYNGISHTHQQFLADGGAGILAGDGALSYGGEEVMEAYYNFQVREGVNFSLDFQFINNPAFNTARGPVFVFGARLHLEY